MGHLILQSRLFIAYPANFSRHHMKTLKDFAALKCFRILDKKIDFSRQISKDLKKIYLSKTTNLKCVLMDTASFALPPEGSAYRKKR